MYSNKFLDTSSSLSNNINFSPQKFSGSYRRLLNHMCTAENGRLANARIEKQMRQYLQKWGKKQARKESIKVQKYDLNSFKIANQRSSYGRISKRQNFTGGSVVINKNSYGGRFKNDNDGELRR